MSDLRTTPCDGCGIEADCQVRQGVPSEAEQKTKSLWFLSPPGWWASYYTIPNGPNKGAMMIINRCPKCIDEVAKATSKS